LTYLFFCRRLSATMPPSTCVARRRLARMATAASHRSLPESAYSCMASCLYCEEGRLVEKNYNPEPLPKKPKAVRNPKAKTKPKPKTVDHRTLKPTKPMWEKELCSKCGKWVVYAKGMCKSCYEKEYRRC
jgi:hypothetical protein